MISETRVVFGGETQCHFLYLHLSLLSVNIVVYVVCEAFSSSCLMSVSWQINNKGIVLSISYLQ